MRPDTIQDSHSGLLLDSSSGMSLQQDDGLVEWPALRRLAHSLARSLARFRRRRVALVSSRVTSIVPALLAAQAEDVGLMLLRTLPSGPLPDAWNVSAVLLDDGSLETLSESSQIDEGFCVLLATSGTTGTPKIARHAWQSLTGRIRIASLEESPPRWLLTYHPAAFGGLQVVLTAMLSGCELIASSELQVPSIAQSALHHLPTHVSGTPTFWRSLLSTLGSAASRIPVRQITLGGEAADQLILDRLRKVFPDAAITHIYASTEAGALFAVRDCREGFPSQWLETGIDGVRLRICGEVLEVRSPRSMESYLDSLPDPRTGDGWIHTGDLVEQRGDRVLFRGREDTVLSVGGSKVRPEEIEESILAVPGVADVRVYGAPNPITGFLVAADIIPAPGTSPHELRSEILAQLRLSLESFKIPRILKFVDALPTSAGGKKRRNC